MINNRYDYQNPPYNSLIEQDLYLYGFSFKVNGKRIHPSTVKTIPHDFSVDELSQIIREVDGENTLGAGALAEAIMRKIRENKLID